MSILRKFLIYLGFHQHEWGTLHRATVWPSRVIVVETCYACGKDRVVKVRFE
jgi:hypothetical protein